MMQTKRRIDQTKIAKAADLLKTIAHPVRLGILEALEQNAPLTVSELQETLEITVEQSLLSHHLIKMKDRGVLQCERQGQFIRYSLTDTKLLRIFDCLETCDCINT